MTNFKNITAPNEIISHFQNVRCSFCKNKVDELWSMDTGGAPKEYSSEWYCSTDPDGNHSYHKTVYWEDPKKIINFAEDITFYDETKQYYVCVEYFYNEWITRIKIKSLDELGHPNEDAKIISEIFEEKYFDFSKFNAKRYIDRIRTLILFS